MPKAQKSHTGLLKIQETHIFTFILGGAEEGASPLSHRRKAGFSRREATRSLICQKGGDQVTFFGMHWKLNFIEAG